MVFSYETRIGEAAIIPKDLQCCLGRRMALVRLDPAKYDSHFFLYYFLSPDFQSLLRSKTVNGATVDRISLTEFPDFPVPNIPIADQKRIASVLSNIDDKIELNRRMNETLEAMAQAIFRDWFVDFGPVRRKMAGATDPSTILGGLLPPGPQSNHLANLFPDRLGADDLPEGWAMREIGTLAEIVGGATPSTSNESFWNDGRHAWATPKDLSKLNGRFVFETERQITNEGLKKIGSGLSPAGSVLMSSRAPIGYVAIAACPVAVNQGFIVVRPTAEFPTEYAYFWLHENMDLIKSNANGSTFQEISKTNFRPLPIVRPPNEIMQTFVALTSPMLESIRIREMENITLAETRDYLLPKLMSGAIRVEVKQTENPSIVDLFGASIESEGDRLNREAIALALVVDALREGARVVGDTRVQKGVYLLFRRSKLSVQQFRRNHFGPFHSSLAKENGTNIALDRSYVQERASLEGHKGYRVGANFAEAKALGASLGFDESSKWVRDNLRGLSREELEVLSTVDMSMLALKKQGVSLIPKTVLEDIAATPAWRAKLTKSHFSGSAISNAIATLNLWFPEDF